MKKVFTSRLRKDLFWVALIGLALQAFWGLRLQHPSYMDGYYYATNGQRLADGYGFTEQIIWQFLDNPAGLPTPSHTYWMPLPSLLAAAGYKVVANFRGAQLPFWLLAGLLPLLAFAISWRLSGDRWQAWTAALLTASGGFYNNFFSQPATFAPFAWAGGVCLLALALVGQKKGASRWWLLAGFTAGLGHLTRADGVLLLLVALVVWIGVAREQQWGIGKLAVALGMLLGGYFLVMGGWFVRNWMVMERPLSTAGTQTIFLTNYDDLFAFGRSFGLPHFLAWGWPNILRSKLDGLAFTVVNFTVVSFLIFLTPFIVWAWWRLGRWSKWAWIRPLTWYGLALFIAMSLVFTLPGKRGGLLHSSAALWPWLMVLAAAGIDIAIEWRTTRWPHPRPQQAKRIYTALFIFVAFVMGVSLGFMRSPDSTEAVIYEEIGDKLPNTAVVMVGNAPGFYYHTGLAAVSVPNESVEVMLRAASQYHVTHLVLDQNRPNPLHKVYKGEEQRSEIQLIETYEQNGRGDVKLYKLLDVE